MGYALLISLIAGLFTALGGLAAILLPPGEKTLAGGLGFAAGVMLTVSLEDMLPEVYRVYAATGGNVSAVAMTAGLFMLGALVALLLDICLPQESELYHKRKNRSGLSYQQSVNVGGRKTVLPKNGIDIAADHSTGLLRGAIVTVAVVVLHNLPEGILTMFTSYADPRMGLTVALAIGLHNFPEGIVIAVPVRYATDSCGRAFWASLLSGLAEPTGAILAFLALRNFLNPLFLNGLLATVAGMMSAVSFFELLDMGYRNSCGRWCSLGALLGCTVMSVGIYCIS